MAQEDLHDLDHVWNATGYAILEMTKGCLFQNDVACMKIALFYHISF